MADNLCEFSKVDEVLGLVYGWAIVCKDNGEDYYDLHGDHIPEDAMTKATADFMLNSRAGKIMHVGADEGDVVFGLPITEETCKAFGFTSERTGFALAWRPRDIKVLGKFKDGTYKGFSIGGSYGETEELANA